jgi:hypothetical protein
MSYMINGVTHQFKLHPGEIDPLQVTLIPSNWKAAIRSSCPLDLGDDRELPVRQYDRPLISGAATQARQLLKAKPEEDKQGTQVMMTTRQITGNFRNRRTQRKWEVAR